MNAREVVAKETGVSPATIMRDAAYAEAGRRKMAVIGGAKNQNAKVAINHPKLPLKS